jgi:hypothetical protein
MIFFLFCNKKENSLPSMNFTTLHSDTLIVAKNKEVDATIIPKNSINKTQHRANYESLLNDGVLNITFAVGFTEEYATIKDKGHITLHDNSLEIIHQWLARKGWKRLNGLGANPEIFTGTSTFKIPGEYGFWEQNAQIHFKIIQPQVGSAELFADALEDNEVLVYMGHSRFGIGPDFDHIKSKDGNFVIGINAPQHKKGACQAASENAQLNVVSPTQNALADWSNAHKSPQTQARIIFFNACNSFRYLDEWRNNLTPEALRSTNTDLICTRGSVNLGTVAYSSTAFIDQIIEGNPLESIPNFLDKIDKKARLDCGLYLPEEVAGFHQVYFWDGITDNPVFKNLQ